MIVFNRILFPVSLTQISPQIVPYISSLAKQYESEIHLLHVAHKFDTYIDTYVAQTSKTDLKQMASNFEKEFSAGIGQKLQDFKMKYFDDNPKVIATLQNGTHYKEILAYADSHQIDLIVMGTGRSVVKAVFGSVRDKVSKLSKVPVMLIKTA